MIIQNINVVITGFKVKFKYKIIRWKANGRVSFKCAYFHDGGPKSTSFFPVL